MPLRDRLVERREQLELAEPGGAAHDVELELGARGRRQLEQVGGPRRQPGEPAADHLADALRAAELRQRPRDPQRPAGEVDRARLDERPPQLAHEERVAHVSSRIARASSRRLGAEPPPDGELDELRHLVAGELGEPQAHDVVAAQVGERLRQRLGHVGLGVAEGDRRGRAPRGARQVAQEQERRRRRPSARPRGPARRAGGRVTPASRSATAVCRRWRSVSGSAATGGGRPADRGAEVGQQPRQLAAARAQRLAQLVGVGRPRQLVQRLHERPVGRADDRVAGAVEHERAVVRGLRRRTRARAGSCPSPRRRRPARSAGARPARAA